MRRGVWRLSDTVMDANELFYLCIQFLVFYTFLDLHTSKCFIYLSEQFIMNTVNICRDKRKGGHGGKICMLQLFTLQLSYLEK